MRWIQRPARQDDGQAWSQPPVPLLALASLAVVGLGAGALAAADAVATRSDPPARHPALSPIQISPGVHNGKASPSAPGGGLTPAQIRAAYDLAPLYRQHIDGAKQTIVIVDSFGSPTIAVGPERTSTPTSACRRRRPSGSCSPPGAVPPYHASNSNRSGWAAETTLDVEWAHVIAPDASIVLVETPTSENEGTTGFPQIVAAEKYVLRHKLGQVISQSFAATEQTFSAKSGYAAIRNLRGAYELANAITSPCSPPPATRARRATSTTWWTSTPPARFPGRPPTRSSPLSAAPS